MSAADASPTRAAPRYVRPGTGGHHTELIPFTAGDGLPLTVLHITRADGAVPTRGPVLLVHGAGVRAEIFRPPLPRTLVDALLEDGFDVWLLNWRASIDLPPVAWTLDEAAAFDFPAAVRLIRERTGADTLKAFVHCQGSTAFTIAAISGLVPEVTTIVTNAVSLHTVVPTWSRVKILALSPTIRRFTPTLSPRWGYRTEGWFSRVLRTGVTLTHRECDNPVCAMVSFVYGSGRPALWSHANLDGPTHDWIRGEFAGAPMTFFAQMRQSVLAGHLVPTGTVPGILPDLMVAPRTDARFVFLAGEDNRCFLPEGQQRSFEHFNSFAPGRHALHRLPGYGHLDVIFGVRAWQDTHPLIVDELRR
ncbi:MAG: alpha/beta fold hydrolase [Propionicimonas sp.]